PPLLAAWNAERLPAILFAPDVQVLPLRTAALPPSTHTNAYLIGHDPAYLLDPGPADASEQQVLFELLDEKRRAGQRLAAIILTHPHIHHVGAAGAASSRYALPIWAHARTAEALRGSVAVDRELNEGDRIDLGRAPDGNSPWFLETLHTPGHAAGHLSFHEPRYQLLFVGDMVSTQSSVVIAPPDGDLTLYLASLHRLRSMACRLLLPAHGSPSARHQFTIDEALAHRAKREEQLLQALKEGPRLPLDL